MTKYDFSQPRPVHIAGAKVAIPAKIYVVVRFCGTAHGYQPGTVKIWRDYGETWGAPAYEVMDYFTSYAEARKYAKQLRKV